MWPPYARSTNVAHSSQSLDLHVMGFIEFFTWTYADTCSYLIFFGFQWLRKLNWTEELTGSSSPIAYRKPASLR
jgi:hypothetical protein